MTEPEILEAWRVNGLIQSRRGTLMHWHIEMYLNGYDLAEPQSPEFLQFLCFKQSFLDPLGLLPLRTEFSMFHCGLCMAGQADLLCLDGNGEVVIIDWKRSANIKTQGFRGQMLHAPLEHMAIVTGARTACRSTHMRIFSRPNMGCTSLQCILLFFIESSPECRACTWCLAWSKRCKPW